MERDLYLSKLISRMDNGLVKVITGIRRCGKSYLVFSLFKKYLLEECKVPAEHVIELALDEDANSKYRNPMRLCEYLRSRINLGSERFYVLIDEIQYCYRVKRDDTDESLVAPEDRDSLYITFYNVLNGLLRLDNVDIYVTGSNSKKLSDDVNTIFRGRGDEPAFIRFRSPNTMPVLKATRAMTGRITWHTAGCLWLSLRRMRQGEERILSDCMKRFI